MKKVLVATDKPFAKEAVDGIRNIVENAGFAFSLLEKYGSKTKLLDATKDANAVIIRSDIIDKEVIDNSSNLEIVVRAGAGYDNVDLDSASANDVVVMNTPGQNANAVAELAFGMMVFSARNKYNGTSGTELRGKNIGIHAYGNIGKLVASIAKGFGMNVYAFDPFVDKSTIEKDGVTALATVEELYSTCQYISLHIPATEQTKNSINKELLSKMPANGVLVNTARKEVIDEKSVLELMAENEKFVYLSDVAPSNRDAFESNYADRVFFTPKKLGAQTAEANINAGLAAARQIVNFFNNGDTTFQVNK